MVDARRVEGKVKPFGVGEIADVRIKRVDLPKQ